MTRITELDTETVERIAAGEVVTRPASVVVELVENALDAGTESVEITVENAGLDLIRVADDGHGMAREDAALSVERHTTSKIRDVADVERISTLGFRGEALPSIAHAARLELTTKHEESGVAGTRVVVDGDEKRVTAAGRAVGTTVSVRDLFERIPARRKSLAQPKREFARVSEAVTGYALTHPEVRFSLTHDGRNVVSTPGSGSYTDAVLGVYGRETAGESTTVDHRADGIEVRGLLVYPSITRAGPTHVTTAVNGRTLRDSTIRGAVREGYGSLLPDGRYPVAVVDVSLPPEDVNANVHPAKEAVAFHDSDAVANAVERAVSGALSTEDLSRTADLALDLDAAVDDVEGSAFESIAVIGQFRELYLLCEADDDLLVVDQHAAHERINYERLRAAVGDGGSNDGTGQGGVESADIEPRRLPLTASEAALAETHRGDLAAIGFRFETDRASLRVTGVPAPLGRVASPEALRDALDTLAAGEEPTDPRDELLKEFACHPSLKAGDALTTEAATRLVRRLGACEQAFACPHGRPTVLRIDEAAFARGFERPNTRF
ncbi:DNA mismatch repair endonuclease MutL [Halococcus hamelinensis]|uniref:DNA mismatch repair protein MutL n=2 Tax=Halococcus hamelinensis TaxID=332168 RepID=M0LZK0_9EURY|nr:DNA mismatch repair endonuclease MutL [Halococcus hamelinensis]EMA38871.1 DNA mismatch repair protein MutL [Halococcus hamelinensis 100A6]